MKQVVYSDKAQKFLSRITRVDSQRIREKIKQYAENPEELKNQVKKLTNSIYYRLRIGDYRVLFTEDLKIVYVERVGNRGDIYKGV